MKNSPNSMPAACAAGLALLFLAGCQSNIKPLEPVKSTDNFCPHGEPKRSSILSVMSSLADTPRQAPEKTSKDVLTRIKSTGGTVAHWDDLAILLPVTARTYGDADGYVHVVAAAIDDPPGEPNSRTVDVLLAKPKGGAWREFQAYDVQSVCMEGNPKS